MRNFAPIWVVIAICGLFCHGTQAQQNDPFAEQVSRLAVGDALEAPIQFDLGSARLTSSSMALLRGVANQMQVEQGLRYAIEGHTDMSGSYALNQRLSAERAQAVVTFLVNHGVHSSRLEPYGYAYDHLLPDVPMNDHRHRRVMFKRIR